MTAQNETKSFTDSGGATAQSLNMPQDFLNRVKEAVQRLQSEGIILWRPYVDDEITQVFDVSIIDGSVGCINESCNHSTHDPSSPSLKIIPKEGKLIYLGVLNYGEIRRTYYALLRSSDTLYYEVVEEPHYYTKIFQIDGQRVPDFMFERFNEQSD